MFSFGPLHADANGIGLGRNTCVADVDIVIARGEIAPAPVPNAILPAPGVLLERTNTGGRVEVAGGVVKERITTGGRVEVAGDVVKKRLPTGGRVEVAERVAKERINTGGRVVAADGVTKEPTNTDGRVGDAGGVVKERVFAQERVDVGGVAALLTNCSRLRRKRKADEHTTKRFPSPRCASAIQIVRSSRSRAEAQMASACYLAKIDGENALASARDRYLLPRPRQTESHRSRLR